jgi:flagellin
MGITLGYNIASLQVQRRLAEISLRLSEVYERLSSGQRINRPSDDAAGLAIADRLRSDQRLASVAIRNANDGISLLSIADGALAQISAILTRMAELAEQSANGVYTNEQRSALQNEFVALGSEIQRIADTTTFNGVTLLSGSSTIALQVGLDGSSNSRITISNVQAQLQNIGLADAGSKQLNQAVSTQAAAQTALDAVKTAINNVSMIRGSLGAAESRLKAAISNLQVAKENFAAAESRIRDADIAYEAAELTRLSILQQSALAVLAQANQQPALVLALLKIQ